MEMKGKGCCIPLTIERQLKRYTECENHTDRHEILWHEWNHNKRWLTQIQQLILPSFPSYSLHDATHSEAVLHNIEMFLGEENIQQLSATDCFMILHTVYIHDIGMCLTHEDRKKFLSDHTFQEYLKNVRNSGDVEMRKFASILLERCISIDGVEKEKKIERILEGKLEIYYAIIYLMSDYRRAEHGEVSKERLVDWVDNPRKLGIGFSTIEIPNRLFYTVADCAATHADWDFGAVLRLHQEDTGFAYDYIHPRFIAVLLQLGDALDMDNNRFHPLANELLGEFPPVSRIHYGKHKAIRRLRITNQKISIGADCESQEILRRVRQECDSIRSILEKAAYYWSVIKPKELNIGLPTLDRAELLLNGEKISEKLVQTKFEISQDKAFHLLQGNNIYENENLVFLRELIQNAVDATKLQYFHDCRRYARRGVEIGKELIPSDAAAFFNPYMYPIEIDFIMAKQKDGVCQQITKKDLDNPEDKLRDYDCGVLVRIRDYGTGIGESDVEQIADVGTSYESRKDEIEKMPKWLQPTGTFGIGLQSVFLVTDKLKADTLTHRGESYKIEFNPRRGKENGYINVIPDTDRQRMKTCSEGETENEDGNVLKTYGTCFELFVSYDKKKLHKDSRETWDGEDPFKENYDETKKIRHTRELIKQMCHYLSNMVGEPLFPIYLHITDPYEDELRRKRQDEQKGSLTNSDKSGKEEQIGYYESDFCDWFRDAGMMIYINDNIFAIYESKTAEDKKVQEEDKKPRILWAYDKNVINISGDDLYYFDQNKMKLNVWNREYNAYGCLGINRILKSIEAMNQEEHSIPGMKCKIYYKGIKVTEKCFEEDSNLLEYIDLKDTLDNQYLKLNRNYFSQEGDKRLEKIYRAVLDTVRRCLKHMEDEGKYIPQIKEYLKESVDNSTEPAKVKEQILSATAFAFFAMVHEKNNRFLDRKGTDDGGNTQEKTWNSIIKWILKLKEMEGQGTNLNTDKELESQKDEETMDCSMKENDARNLEEQKKEKVLNKIWNNSTLFQLPVWELTEHRNTGKDQKFGTVSDSARLQSEKQSIVEIIDSDQKYAIMSIRDKTNNFWREYIVHMDSALHQEIKTNISMLHSRQDMSERKRIMETLTSKVSDFFKTIYAENERQGANLVNVFSIKKQAAVIKWLLENIPTMAIFSDDTGNKRLNILDKEVCDTVYFDNNMRYLVMERMLEENQKKPIQRFNTIAWSGYRALVLKENRPSILSVNRGKRSEIGCSEMIFPLTAKDIQYLMESIVADVQKDMNEISIIHHNIVEPLIQCLQKKYDSRINSEDLEFQGIKLRTKINMFWEKIKRSMKAGDYSEQEIESIDCSGEMSQFQCEKCIDEMGLENKVPEETNEKVSEDDTNVQLSFDYVICVLQKAAGIWNKKQYSNKFAEQMQSHSDFSRLIKYVMKHSKMGTVEDEVKNYYYNLIVEIDYALRTYIKNRKLEENEEISSEFCDCIRSWQQGDV